MSNYVIGFVYALVTALICFFVEVVLARWAYHTPFSNYRFLFSFVFVIACKVGELMNRSTNGN